MCTPRINRNSNFAYVLNLPSGYNSVHWPITLLAPPHLRLSASWGSMPGNEMAMEDGAPTSYRRMGLRHSLTLTRHEYTASPTAWMGGWRTVGKKLPDKSHN